MFRTIFKFVRNQFSVRIQFEYACFVRHYLVQITATTAPRIPINQI